MVRLFVRMACFSGLLCFFAPVAGAEPGESEKKVTYCLRLAGVDEVKVRELGLALQQVLVSLGWQAEALGGNGHCCTAGDCENKALVQGWLVEMDLLRIGPMVTVSVRSQGLEKGEICERKKTFSGTPEAKAIETFRDELAICLPKPPRAFRPSLGQQDAAGAVGAAVPKEPQAQHMAAGVSSGASAVSVSSSQKDLSTWSYNKWGHVLFWSGLALEIGGIMSMALAQSEYNQIKKDLSGDPGRVETLGGVGIAGAVLGGLGMAGGVLFWLFAKDPPAVTPVAGEDYRGLIFSVRW